MAEANETTRKRSEVADVDRSLYDFKMSEEGYERYTDGLSTDIVRAISEKKDEPDWMLEMRLKALAVYEEMEMPANWGPSIEMLDLNHISAYVSPKTKQAVALLSALALDGKRVTVVVDDEDINTYLAFRNLPKVNVIGVSESNTRNLLDNGALVMSTAVAKQLEEVLA